MRVSRRASLVWVGAAASLAIAENSVALEPEVPIRLQISLLDRVIPYDRNFAIRVHGRLTVAVLVDEQNVDSVRVGAQLYSELTTRKSLGNYGLSAARLPFVSVARLTEECKRLRAGVVYVTPGLREATGSLAAALQGLKALSVGTVPEQVSAGLVLGSAVRSGKPRVLVNLKQARQHEVDFRADFLRMVEVVG